MASLDRLTSFLHKLGLSELYPNKLTLNSLLKISRETISDKDVKSLKQDPLAFLRKLLRMNAQCRDVEESGETDGRDDDGNDEDENEINPLDLVTALYLCADSFLQQEMSMKMSMCQFAVPFLLPQPDNNQYKLMLWALRNIHKEWRPHSLMDTKGYVEDSVVHAKIPLITFVRLKDCSVSKSQYINRVLSNEQSKDFFTHKEMNGGHVPKEIANGLVEIVWCLPCGQSNIDVFPEPVAIANMRGDISSNKTQFRFLMQVSAAVFVSLDSVTEEEEKLLDLQGPQNSKLFLLVNSTQDKKYATSVADLLKSQEKQVLIQKQNSNMAKFSSHITRAIKVVLKECKEVINIEKMSDIARQSGISVDEDESKVSKAKCEADKIVNGIGICEIPDYKKKHLPLQGEHLKKIAKIEIEECRLRDAGDLKIEEYKAQLQEKKFTLREEQGNTRPSEAMQQFIKALSTTDKEQATLFLKWLTLKLDRKSRQHLTESLGKYVLCQEKDNKSITEADQQLLDNSLGIEHFMREMAQIYESKKSDDTKHLPSVAAGLLLDGYPIELLNGDASTISEKWVTDVLMELHRKEGSSRLLVVSVLGVQSTGKSTLLNTMFGVQFPVSSGRCTRGAYMLFLSVGKDVREELKCDFVLLIDTEGLKAPELASLDCSYEHDNQLATLVIGLSDVTIINIAMENSTEMKDVLQIAVHAFLRMRQLGKKPVCHFVHQNVSGVSAHSKLTTDRKHLLEQLNEMTLIAAGMENQYEVKEFTDVLDYDAKKNNWYVPGLWHGTPPMAPVNPGYSEAVHEFKINLLRQNQTENLSDIPDFLKWMGSLWKAVRHENFIFSFRNTLVAYAYDSLCKEFSGWEWSFRKCIYTWLNNAETQISNAETSRVEKESKDLKHDAFKIIEDQTAEMEKNLNSYYKGRDRYVNFVEKYRAEFQIGIKSLKRELTKIVESKLQSAVCLRKDTDRVEHIQKQHTDVMEKKVSELLANCKKCYKGLSDDDLEEEFTKMWKGVKIDVSPLKEKDIASTIMKQLHANLANRNVQRKLAKIQDLTKCGRENFIVKSKHIKGWNKLTAIFKKKSTESDMQGVASNIIQSCEQFIDDIVHTNKDYQEIFSQELLEKIDERLKLTAKVSTTFETDLKVHICGIAAQKFLDMHRNFLSEKSPLKHLERTKKQYLSDFIDSYKQIDQCHRKAKDFTKLCIKPAIREYINRSLGIEIVDGILSSNHSSQYSSRSYFQYSILSELLERDDFESYFRYILRYEVFVKDWIYNQLVEWLHKERGLVTLRLKILKTITEKVKKTIENVQSEVSVPNDNEKATVFVEELCHSLSKYISLPMTAVRVVLFQMSCKRAPFIESLLQSLDDLKKLLDKEFVESINIKDTLRVLTVKPQDEIFKRVFGCGEQCPFCKTPCEAGGKAHTQHHAAVHRPQGIGGFLSEDTGALGEALCTSCVYSDLWFRNADTDFEFKPYKNYRDCYPNWNIPPDPSVESSDYWKYVLVKCNDMLAKTRDCNPAVCPEEWHRITKEQALEGLKAAFNVK